MLKKLRERKTAKKVWIILAILILPAFVLWGSGSLIRSKRESSYAGKIYGRSVPFSEYSDALNAVKNQLIMQFGDNLSEIQKQLNIESQAWDRLILLAEAKKRRINATDKEVIETLKDSPMFSRNGRFDERTYNDILHYVFHTQPRQFEEQTRQDIILTKLYQEVTKDITVTEEEIKKEYQKANEQISIYYIASLSSEFVKDILTTEDAIKEYFSKNSLSFKEPTSFNVEYASLNAEGQNEEEIKNKIKNIVNRLNRKEDFQQVAKDIGLSIKETGFFKETDPIPGIGWAPQLMGLISKIKINEYLPPARLDKNYYILKLKDKKEPYIPDLEKIKDKVKDALIKEKSRNLARERIESALRKLKEGYQSGLQSTDFSQLAQDLGLKSGSTGMFKYGSYIEGIGASDNFFIKAKELKGDNFSDIIDTPAGFYIIKLKSFLPIDEKKFAEEKGEFAKKLLTQKKQERFARFFADLRIKALR